MNKSYQFYASCPKAIEDLVEYELQSFGASQIKLSVSGVFFSGSLETGYRACLWSRIANRIFITLKIFRIQTKDDIYKEVSSFDWNNHFSVNNTFAVTCSITSRKIITNNNYGSLLVKDAIVDYFRKENNKRPDIDKDQPDIRFHLHIGKDQVSLSLNLSGESLHKRGYRVAQGPATLKENVAAAILLRSNWHKLAQNRDFFIDPMCGTGTLPIEAAMIAGDIAPGLLKKKYGFIKWKLHDAKLWDSLIKEAQEKRDGALKKYPLILAYDNDPSAILAVQQNIKVAGLKGLIQVKKMSFQNVIPPDLYKNKQGLVAFNPPYGERLGNKSELNDFYRELGDILIKNFKGWNVSMIVGDEELSKRVGLKAFKVNTLFNGAIKCVLSQFKIYSNKNRIEFKMNDKAPSPGAQMFINRLNKNLKRLKKWIQKEDISSYRIYDADMPEYSAAIDYYEGKWAHIQEYAPPQAIPKEDALRRLTEIKRGAMQVLNLDPHHIFIKQRQRKKGKSQYGKMSDKNQFVSIKESGLTFLINLTDYLDTGIFLDHRITRKMICNQAKGRRFLNLFAYTGTATVYAAAGGAITTTTVDKSKTYLDWAKENMKINQLKGKEHQFIQADCMTFLKYSKETYDLIFLDPPTFSNSKDQKENFDIQLDHVKMIQLTMKQLAKNGLLIFSNNFRKFKLDFRVLEEYSVVDITEETLPMDFYRNRRIHQCWLVEYY